MFSLWFREIPVITPVHKAIKRNDEIKEEGEEDLLPVCCTETGTAARSFRGKKRLVKKKKKTGLFLRMVNISLLLSTFLLLSLER